MARDFQREARQERLGKQVRRLWIQQRIEQIHDHVTAYDVLRQNGVALRQTADNAQEQISCPFHGLDRKPSARIYPADARSPSHVWCYFCQKRWDAIGLWRMFNGGPESTPFTQALAEIERAYSLTVPEMPRDALFQAPEVDEELEAFDALYEACEGRLSLAKPDYERVGDLVGYLTAGSILDKVRHRVDSQKLTPTKAITILEQLRDRIGEKVRTA